MQKETDNRPRQTISQSRNQTMRLAQAAILIALAYIGFQFIRIDIPVGAGKTAFHFGNVFLILAALLLGGLWGGLSGAIGMTVADLTSGYAHAAPATFVLKLMIGLIVGWMADRVLHLSAENDPKKRVWKTAVSTGAGVVFNIIADPLVRYAYNVWLLGIPKDLSKALAGMTAITTLVNGLVAVVAVTLIYMGIYPALKKANLLVKE